VPESQRRALAQILAMAEARSRWDAELTTMNIYGDVATNEMADAHSKIVQMALAKMN